MGGPPRWTWAIGGSQSFPSWKSAFCAPCPPGEDTALSEQGGMEAIGTGYAPEPLQGLSANVQDSVGGCGDRLFLQSPRQAPYVGRLLARAAPALSGTTDFLGLSSPSVQGAQLHISPAHTPEETRWGRKEGDTLSAGTRAQSGASPAAQR